MNEQSPDFIVSELLSELKAENARKDKQLKTLAKTIAAIVVAALLVIGCVVGGFLWYLNQYDFTSSDATWNSAEGVYAVIDSEGNVIGTDFTAEEIQDFMEAVDYGESETGESLNPTED